MIINEIMFDSPGTDTGREWIEIFNNTSSEIDLSSYKFFENSVAHTLDLIKGDAKMQSNSYAIIASDANLFIADYPDFSGTLFDSVFSLNNTGEYLALIDANGNKVNEITYSGEIGGKGDGNTLQLNGEILISAKATPGTLNSNEQIIPAANTSVATSSVSTHSSQVSVSENKESKEISINIGRERLTTINSPIKFEAFRTDQKNEGSLRYFWNLGDGNTKKGKNINHVYKYSGNYNVVLNVVSGTKHAVSRTKVQVLEPKINLFLNDSGLEFKNEDQYELNIGDWQFMGFHFPKDTILSPKNSIIFDKEFFDFEEEKILYFPNGKMAFELI